MGIRDLMKWIRDNHPTVFTSYPKRWAAPEIRGKRIAIDGTLLTNRYHFAIQDGPLKGKGGLVGWYNLINVLRSNAVKPVVVFDERGPREWKAPEAARRLAARALNLSRRSHEDERADRLVQWRQAFKEIEGLAEDEQMSVRAHFENRAKPTSRTNTNTTTEDRVAIQEKLETTTSLDMTEIDAALDRITTMIDTVSDLQSEYLAKISSGVSRKNPQGLTDAIKHVTELERLHEAIGEPKPRDIYRSPPEEEETSVLDEALEQVVPEEAFTESKRQKALTEEEGRIISSFLARRGADVNVDPTSEVEEIFTPDQTPPMTRLEGLIESTPEMKAVYQRALNMPTSSDHDACRDLVIKMGVPVLEARIPYEAEGLAASLTNAGLVDFVGTEDSDVIAYGAPLLRNVSSSVQPLILVSGSKLKTMTTLTSSSFLDFCILCGTDASPRIPSIGPKRAFKLIMKFGSIEAILTQDKYRDKLEDIEGFMKMVGNARDVFGKAPPIPEGLNLEQGVYDEKEVEDWLKDTHGVMFMSAEQVAENAEGEESQEWPVRPGQQDPAGVEEWDETWDQVVVDEPTLTNEDLPPR